MKQELNKIVMTCDGCGRVEEVEKMEDLQFIRYSVKVMEDRTFDVCRADCLKKAFVKMVDGLNFENP